MQTSNQQELLDLTEKLVRFNSLSPHQNGCIDFLEKYLQNLGFNITRVDRNDTCNLIAILGSKKPIFAFAGHIDVVASGDTDKWISPPFQLTNINNRLYGRGIADMKGAISAFLYAIKKYIPKHDFNSGSIAILLTSDEEGAALDGTIAITEYLEQQGITLDYCILGEPSSVIKLGDTIKIGRRGSLNGILEIIGKQGHVAYPHLCKNPIHLFTPALQELINYQWDQGTEFFPPTSLQFTDINSGIGASNVIPNNLHANFNLRYNSLHDANSLINIIIGILKKHNLQYNISWQNSAKPFIAHDGKLVEVVKNTLIKHHQVEPSLKTDGGTSDGRFLIKICSEILELGLINSSIHQINENTPLSDLLELGDMYYNILNKIFND